jgi:hypothetical protein
VHCAQHIPPNDSSLALGQAWAVLSKQSGQTHAEQNIQNLKKGGQVCA